MINNLSIYLYKIFFSLSFILLFFAILEKILNLFDYTLSLVMYTPGRLTEFGAIFLLFAIAFLLRQIRDLLKK